MSEAKTPFNAALGRINEAVADLDSVHQIAVICAALCRQAFAFELSREQVLAGVSGTYDILKNQQLLEQLSPDQGVKQ